MAQFERQRTGDGSLKGGGPQKEKRGVRQFTADGPIMHPRDMRNYMRPPEGEEHGGGGSGSWADTKDSGSQDDTGGSSHQGAQGWSDVGGATGTEKVFTEELPKVREYHQKLGGKTKSMETFAEDLGNYNQGSHYSGSINMLRNCVRSFRSNIDAIGEYLKSDPKKYSVADKEKIIYKAQGVRSDIGMIFWYRDNDELGPMKEKLDAFIEETELEKLKPRTP